MKGPVCDQIDEQWDNFLTQLQRRVKNTAPEMMPFLESLKDSLQSIKEEVKDKASKTIAQVSLGANEAHRSVQKSIQKKWEVPFKKAANEVGQ